VSLIVELDRIEEILTLSGAEAVSMNSAKYDHAAKLREQRRILELIPPPDGVFIAAAKNACIQAGLSQEIIDILHPPGLEPIKKHSE
jgi:hypothetical protein